MRLVPLVVSTGCPAGVGPEVSVAAAARLSRIRTSLVGDPGTLFAAAEMVGVSRARLMKIRPGELPDRGRIGIVAVGPELVANDRRPGEPTKRAGAAQLAYIDAAYEIAKRTGAALVSGPVSKAAIAHSGAQGASRFRGHTEWLRDRDGAPYAIMCFVAPRLVTSLVTTHVPLSKVSRAISAGAVRNATAELGRLLLLLGKRRPALAVASLNPHAGEGELLGSEETRAIVPGIQRAARDLGRSATVSGPVGAETAYRLAYAGKFDGVVAMYHDQATIPMKLVAFGVAVNVTMGLGIVRTSVDHGTAYDISWTGTADVTAMESAMRLAHRMSRRTAR